MDHEHGHAAPVPGYYALREHLRDEHEIVAGENWTISEIANVHDALPHRGEAEGTPEATPPTPLFGEGSPARAPAQIDGFVVYAWGWKQLVKRDGWLPNGVALIYRPGMYEPYGVVDAMSDDSHLWWSGGNGLYYGQEQLAEALAEFSKRLVKWEPECSLS